MGVNLGLRLLAMGLSVVLCLLIVYYFLVVNRSINPPLSTQANSLKMLDAEKRKAEAALLSKVKSAIAQTKRLHGYAIGVEYKDGMVVLTGEVPTEIDKELAANLARETLSLKEITNQISIMPAATPQSSEGVQQELSINVDDLELQANLRERVLSIPDLKTQRITIKVQHRIVTLTGEVASESQKLRVEQLLRNYPRVTAVNNHLRIGPQTASGIRTPPTSIMSEQDQALVELVRSSLNTNRADFSQMEAIKVAVQDGAITLSGSVPSQAERARAEQLTKQVVGMKSVKNLIVIGIR